MDALMLLSADHNRVRGLFARFTEAHEDDDTALMTELCLQIATELKVHTTIEEEIFYPALRDCDDERFGEDVAEAVEEHHVVDVLLEELASAEPASEAWVAKVQVLMENVEHHASEEESEMFPEVRKAFTKDALVEQAERLEARKAELGAPTAADKESLSTEDLKALARDQQIPGRSSMGRDELVATVAPA
jgi:hemerythrin superfamily protein